MEDKFSNITLEEMRSGRFEMDSYMFYNNVMLLNYLVKKILSKRAPEKHYVWVMSSEFAERIHNSIDFPQAFSIGGKLIMLYEIPVVVEISLFIEDESEPTFLMSSFLWLKEVAEDTELELMPSHDVLFDFYNNAKDKLDMLIGRNRCIVTEIKSLYTKLFDKEHAMEKEFDDFINAYFSQLL